MKRVVALFVLLIGTISSSHAQQVADTLGTDCIGVFSASSLLEGKVSGVRVMSSDGSLNGKHLIYIRGLNSLHSDSQPLIIVDGAIVNQGTITPDAFYQKGETNSAGDKLPDYSGRSYTSSLDEMGWLDLYDIESIEVLKDISETAAYGLRGANGVVIIKTRKGGNSKGSINVRTGVGVSDSFRSGDVFRTGLIQNHHAAISGNTSSGISYNTSLFYKRSSGPVKNNYLSNGGLALNVETKANKIFWFGLNARFGIGKGSYPSGTSYIGAPSLMSVVRMPYMFTDDTVQGWLSDYDDDSQDYRTVGSAYVRVNFLPSLSMTLTGGIDYFNNRRHIWYGNETSFGKDFNGAAAILNASRLNLNSRLSIDYSRYFASAHHLQASVAAEAFMSDIRNNSMNGTDFVFHQLRAKGLSASNSRNSINRTHYSSLNFSVQGVFKYDFAKYVGLTALLNTEWNRHFEPSVNFFPAADGYVNFKEIFLRDVDIVDEIKLNAGWGTAGAEDYFQGLYRLYSNEWNVGLSAGLFDRFNFAVKYYDKITDETLYGALQNLEPVQISNRGVEFDAQVSIINKSSLKWGVYADAAFNKSNLERTVPKFLAGLGTTLDVAGFTIQARASSTAGYCIIDANKYIGETFTGFVDADYKKADYLKLDHLSVAYRIPVRLKWINTLMVQLTGKNLFYASAYDGCNPNVSCYAHDATMFGVDYGSYPVTRSVILGLNLLF